MASTGMELVTELNEQRGTLITQARAFIHKKGDEAVTAEDMASFDAAMADADLLGDRVTAEERSIKAEAEMLETREIKAGAEDKTPDEVLDKQQFEDRMFKMYLVGGAANPALTVEERQYMAERINPISAFPAQPQGTMSTGTGSEGGYTVPEEFLRVLKEAQLAFGGMREVATVMNTATGAAMLMPTTNDTTNKGEIIAENAEHNALDVVFAQQSIGSFTYSSKIIKVPVQLMQDSAFNLNSHLAKVCGTRIARITNEHFTTGAGTTLPFGIVTGSTLGKTGASGQTATIIYDDFVDLEHSIDPAYRSQGCKWMFHDSTLAAAKKLVDGNDWPLWQPGLAYGAPDKILNYSYEINQDMAVMGVSAKSILFGLLSEYLIRDVLGVQMLRLVERYAEFLQIGFMAYSRHDGLLLNAGGNPVKHYINAAS